MKTYKVIKLQTDNKSLICNSDFEFSKGSEVIAVQKIATMQFVNYYIINYYKAYNDKIYRNKFFNEVLKNLGQNDEYLYVRFNANDVITQNNNLYQLCVDKCTAPNIIEIVSTYKAMLSVMKNIKAVYQHPEYELSNGDYCCDDGYYVLQNDFGYFALANNLEFCTFYSGEFSFDFPECVNWRIYWFSEKEYENTLLSLYKDEDFVLYLTNKSAWYDNLGVTK